MAALTTGLKEYVDELTKCPICLEDLVYPKSLPCLHTFCFQCIKDHYRDDSPGNQVNCPVCRSSFAIPVGGVELLPHDFKLKGLADAKKTSDEQAEILSGIECCEHSGNRLEIHCIECNDNVCVKCLDTEKHRGHNCQYIKEVRQTLRDTFFCRHHPSNELEIHCIECDENMCNTCSHGKKHREHLLQVRPIEEVHEEFQVTINRDIEQVLEKEKLIQREVDKLESEHQKANDFMKEQEIRIAQIVEEIKRQVDEASNQLTLRLSNEKTHVSKAAIDRNNQLEFELAAFQSFTRYSSELVKHGKPCDITRAYAELHTRAGELLQREARTHDYQLPGCTVSADGLFDALLDWISTRSPRTANSTSMSYCEQARLGKIFFAMPIIIGILIGIVFLVLAIVVGEFYPSVLPEMTFRPTPMPCPMNVNGMCYSTRRKVGNRCAFFSSNSFSTCCYPCEDYYSQNYCYKK